MVAWIAVVGAAAADGPFSARPRWVQAGGARLRRLVCVDLGKFPPKAIPSAKVLRDRPGVISAPPAPMSPQARG